MVDDLNGRTKKKVKMYNRVKTLTHSPRETQPVPKQLSREMARTTHTISTQFKTDLHGEVEEALPDPSPSVVPHVCVSVLVLLRLVASVHIRRGQGGSPLPCTDTRRFSSAMEALADVHLSMKMSHEPHRNDLSVLPARHNVVACHWRC